MNSVNFIGNLGARPDLRYGRDGSAWCVARVALQSSKEKTSWIDVKAFGSQAEQLGKSDKGMLVAVSGRLEQENWTDKNTGENRSKLVVVANAVRALGGSRSSGQPSPNRGSSDDYGSDVGLEDIPF